MTTGAKIVADSISLEEIRLVSMQLRYPRAAVHEEFLTHRALSRNASSSRAIPVEKMIEDIMTDPALPVHWGKNQKGMQAYEECNAPVVIPLPYVDDDEYVMQPLVLSREHAWLRARDQAVETAYRFHKAGYHKQVVNLLLRPWEHISVIVSSTEWVNFFALRRHETAKPEFKILADLMWEAQQASTPVLLKPGQWHLPYCPDVHGKYCTPESDDAIKASAARCARVSSKNHDGTNPDLAKDIALHDTLAKSEPLHASPLEHQATPDLCYHHETLAERWGNRGQWGNFVGWRQYRKMLPGEYVKDR